MSNIRQQSIISSAIVYIGFALGFLNTYLFTREGGFSTEQYGLYGTFISIANIMFSCANLGMMAYVYKFYPYYKDNLPPDKNDMMTWALLTSFVGFVFVAAGGFIFKGLVITKFGAHSPGLVTYYYWIFPLGFGLTFYSLLEAFAWQLRKSVLTNALREIFWRIFQLILMLLFYFGVLKKFSSFIKIFSFSYLFIAFILLVYLTLSGNLNFTFTVSKVSRKFKKKILILSSFIWSGTLIHNLAIVFSPVVIAAVLPNGLENAAIFTLATLISSLIQAPQRAIIAASISHLAQAWKDKDIKKINRIYHSSSINQILFSAGMFILIWINFSDGVITFHLQRNYLDARHVFLFIGIMKIIDMGTGLNSQIISTSTYWRFEFYTGMILLAITVFLNYILTKQIGVVGAAIADLIAGIVYNGIRFLFLYRKFDMQPFTVKSVYALLLALAGYAVCHFLFKEYIGLGWIVIRSFCFIGIYLTGIVLLNLSPDLLPVWRTFKKRLGLANK